MKHSAQTDFYEGCRKYLSPAWVKVSDIIKPFKSPIRKQGAIAILKGISPRKEPLSNMPPSPPNLMQATLTARVFDSEEEALQAVLQKNIHPGEAVFIRYEGPKGSGMPEMFYTTEAIASDPELAESIALITDGRFPEPPAARPSDTSRRKHTTAVLSPWLKTMT